VSSANSFFCPGAAIDDLHPAFEKIFPISFRKFVRFRPQAFCRFRSSSAFWIYKIFGMASFVAHIDKIIFPQIVHSVHLFVYRQQPASPTSEACCSTTLRDFSERKGRFRHERLAHITPREAFVERMA